MERQVFYWIYVKSVNFELEFVDGLEARPVCK